MKVLLARVGKERLYTEAVDSHIGGWFRNAAVSNPFARSRSPSTITNCPSRATRRFSFTATVDVQPKPEVADWTTLEVPRAEPDVPEEMVDQELELLRDTAPRSSPPRTGRRAKATRSSSISCTTARVSATTWSSSAPAADPRDRSGSGRHVGRRDEGGFDLRRRPDARGDRQGAEGEGVARAGRRARALRQRVRSLAELREDIERRLREQLEDAVESEYRSAALGELVQRLEVRGLARARSSARDHACCASSSSRSSAAASTSRPSSR